MRRVVFVIYHPEFGGPHNQALRIARPLQEYGWEMVVVLPDTAGDSVQRLRDNGIWVEQVSLRRARASRDLRLLASWLGHVRHDISQLSGLFTGLGADIVLSCGMVNPQPALAARRAAKPLVWQIVDTRTPVILRVVMMGILRKSAGALMTTGMAVARVHPGALGFGARLVPFFPPVDTDEFVPSPSRRAAARRELNIGPAAEVIGNVSNINPQKGHQTFIHAAAELKKSRPSAKFVILGATYPHRDAYTDSLFRLAESLGLRIGQDLIVRNPGGRVADLAPAFDVFWLTSEPRSEGLPTVVEEAMAMGIPPVVADVGSVRELVTDGTSGFVVPPRDVRAIVDVTTLLLGDQALRHQISAEARRVALATVGVSATCEAHVRAFEMSIANFTKRANQFRGAPPSALEQERV